MKMNKSTFYIGIVVLVLSLASCAKMDDYKKYLGDNPVINYTGKLDSVRIFSGDKRVLVTGLLFSDPKIREARIYWNSGRDSVVVPITRSSGVDTLRAYISDLNEGIYNFQLVTFDDQGNKSVRVYAMGTVYGERYQSSIFHRPLSTKALVRYNGNFKGVLGSIDLSSGIFATEFKYTDKQNNEKMFRIPIGETDFELDDVDVRSPMLSRSLFLPDSTCLDTFYTAFEDIRPDTVFYRNLGDPFTATNISGRWGVLEDWDSNAAANAIGGRGSWDNNTGTGVLAAEAGWGTPAIHNGKIYQTTTLPAGRFRATIEFTRNNVTADVNDTNNLIYFVATDNGVIPDVTAVDGTNTLGYYDLRWRADGYQTVSYEFENPQNQQVTVGFVSNLTSSSNQFFNVRGLSVTMIQE